MGTVVFVKLHILWKCTLQACFSAFQTKYVNGICGLRPSRYRAPVHRLCSRKWVLHLFGKSGWREGIWGRSVVPDIDLTSSSFLILTYEIARSHRPQERRHLWQISCPYFAQIFASSSMYCNYTLCVLGWHFTSAFIPVLHVSWAYCPVYFDLPPLSACSWSSVIISSVIGWMDLWVPTINGWWKPISPATQSLVTSIPSVLFPSRSPCLPYLHNLLNVLVKQCFWS